MYKRQAEAEKFARTIMAKAPVAIKMAKVAINNGMNLDLNSGVAYEAEAYTLSLIHISTSYILEPFA